MTTFPPSSPRRIAVAIVDDDASVRVSLRRLCEVFGLSATAYASGVEFLASLDEGVTKTDCLVLDAQMPEMNGLELRRRLGMRGAHIPTIVCTAADAAGMTDLDDDEDYVEYLQKPVSAKALLAAITRAVSESDQDQAV